MEPTLEDIEILPGVNAFTPEGRLLQIEYAIAASKIGPTSLGICTHEGVVLAAEKPFNSSLVVASSLRKILEIDDHLFCVISGLIQDSDQLIDRARVECQSFWFAYDDTMPVESCVQAVSSRALEFRDCNDGTSKLSRPFGVALLFAGIDKQEPHLWHIDAGGTYIRYGAKAIGSGERSAEDFLVKSYKKDMSLNDAKLLALRTLKTITKGKFEPKNVEFLVMQPNEDFHLFTEEEIEKEILLAQNL